MSKERGPLHNPIVRTPDSATGSKDLYADMVAYLDKSVGKVVSELDRLGVRENTVIVFSGHNSTARQSGTIGRRQVHGAEGSMWEGGTRVPLIVNWKSTAPEGKVLKDMVDFSDFHPTFVELAGGREPSGVTMDGRSFAPQLRGLSGETRDWIYVQLGRNWYVKEPEWKLNQSGELFDMKEAPFAEKPVPADTKDTGAAAARKRLQAVLEQLNPAAGKVETGPRPLNPRQLARRAARQNAKKKKE